MRVPVFLGVALWGCIGLVIFAWNFILSVRMFDNFTPKPRRVPRKQFAFMTDPADYTPLGQDYRRKAIWANLVLIAYWPASFIVATIASWA